MIRTKGKKKQQNTFQQRLADVRTKTLNESADKAKKSGWYMDCIKDGVICKREHIPAFGVVE